MSIETTLQEWQVYGLLVNLFVKTDEREWEGVRECFGEQVYFDMTSMGAEAPVHLTPSQITEAWDEGLKDIEAIHHQVGNFRIQISGNEATASCYGTAYHYKPQSDGRNTRCFVGSYDFHLNLEELGWKVDSLKFNLKFLDGNPDLK